MTFNANALWGRGSALAFSLKQALRRLAAAPTFALATIATLALCLGGNATLLSFLVTLTWRPQAGVRDAGPLVHITLRDARNRLDYPRPSELQALNAAHARTLELASYAPRFGAVGARRESNAATVIEFTSSTFFELLGTRASIGRLLVPRDSDATNAEIPVVISERLWQRDFAARSDIVGQRIYIDGQSNFVIVGVAEPGFHGVEGLVQADVWLPITDSGKEYGSARILGRLRPGVDGRAARAELGVIWQNVARQEAARLAGTGRQPHQTSLIVVPLRAGLHPEQAPMLQRLLGGAIAVTLLVLLIACVNLAGLTLARVLSRRPEIAVRTALGSSMTRLWIDIGTELGILFGIGAGLGLLLAPLIGRALVAALGQPFPFTLDVKFDPATLGLSVGLTAFAVIIAALAPGIQAARVDPASILRAESRSVGLSKLVRRLQGSFVVGQLASAIVLTSAVAATTITARRILRFDLGVRAPESLIVADHGVPATGDTRNSPGSDQALARVLQLPEIAEVAQAYQAPGGGPVLQSRVRPIGVTDGNSQQRSVNIVSPGFFARSVLRCFAAATSWPATTRTMPASQFSAGVLLKIFPRDGCGWSTDHRRR